MQHIILRNNIKSFIYQQFFKAVIANRLLSKAIRLRAQYLLLYFFVNFLSYRNYRLVCMLTGRGRAKYKIFKLSRLKVRELASLGVIPGIRHLN